MNYKIIQNVSTICLKIPDQTFSAIFDLMWPSSVKQSSGFLNSLNLKIKHLKNTGSAISPDYTLTIANEDAEHGKTVNDRGVWVPKPTDVVKVRLGDDLESVIAKFAEHFHDSWASRKVSLQPKANIY